jgi:Tfp pilus assembly protein PilX
MVLALALWSLILLLPLVLTVLEVGAVNVQISQNMVDSKAAEYLAESGLEFAMERILAGTFPGGDYTLGGVGTAHVLATAVDANTQLLTSSGTVNGAVRTARGTAWRPDAASPWGMKEFRQD